MVADRTISVGVCSKGYIGQVNCFNWSSIKDIVVSLAHARLSGLSQLLSHKVLKYVPE